MIARRTDALIVGFAAATPIGLGIEATLAAAGADITAFAETEVMLPIGEPAKASLCELVDPMAPRLDRLCWLAEQACADLLDLTQHLGIDELPIVLALPDGLDDNDAHCVRQAVIAAMGPDTQLRWPREWLFPGGRCAAASALQMGLRLLDEGKCPWVAVGGIDSLVAPKELRAIASANRVLSPGNEGMIPGEAAGMCVLANRKTPGAMTPTTVGLAVVADHQDPSAAITHDLPSGDGLATLLQAMATHMPDRRLDRIWAGHSGEGLFARQFSHAYLRNADMMPEPLRYDLTAPVLGDMGAASLIIGLAFAHRSLCQYAPDSGGLVLCYTQSDIGEITGAILACDPDNPPTWRRAAV